MENMGTEESKMDNPKFEIDKELQARTNQYIKERYNNNKKAFASANLKFSREYLTRYLSDSYHSDPTNMETELRQFFAKLDAGNTVGEDVKTEVVTANDALITDKTIQEMDWKGETLLTSHDAQEVIGRCRQCQKTGCLSMIIGNTGRGKTHLTQKYVDTHMEEHNVFRIECNAIMTVTDLIRAIEKATKVPRMGGSNGARMESIVTFFNMNEGSLLIVDEADKLITGEDFKNGFKRIELLRNIFDTLEPRDGVSDCDKGNMKKAGIMLVGEVALFEKLNVHLPRFRDRFGTNIYEMKGLIEEEVLEYIAGLEFSEDALKKIITLGTKNNFRQLAMFVGGLTQGRGTKNAITTEEMKLISTH